MKATYSQCRFSSTTSGHCFSSESWYHIKMRTNAAIVVFLLIHQFDPGLNDPVHFTSGRKVKSGRNERSAVQFGNMIECAFSGHNQFGFFTAASDFNGYGCYCGITQDGAWPVLDKIDECCKAHDDCYGLVGPSKTWTDYFFYFFTVYDYTCSSSGNITCGGESHTASRGLCECDRAVANCFYANGFDYNATMKAARHDGRCKEVKGESDHVATNTAASTETVPSKTTRTQSPFVQSEFTTTGGGVARYWKTGSPLVFTATYAFLAFLFI